MMMMMMMMMMITIMMKMMMMMMMMITIMMKMMMMMMMITIMMKMMMMMMITIMMMIMMIMMMMMMMMMTTTTTTTTMMMIMTMMMVILFIVLVCSPVGVADPSIIPESSLTASSYFDSRYLPQYGRLNDTRGHGWCPKTMEEASYLQIDLGTRREVCAVVTEEGRYPIEYVESDKLGFSLDGASWLLYKEAGEDKVSKARHWFQKDATTKLLLFG